MITLQRSQINIQLLLIHFTPQTPQPNEAPAPIYCDLCASARVEVLDAEHRAYHCQECGYAGLQRDRFATLDKALEVGQAVQAYRQGRALVTDAAGDGYTILFDPYRPAEASARAMALACALCGVMLADGSVCPPCRTHELQEESRG